MDYPYLPPEMIDEIISYLDYDDYTRSSLANRDIYNSSTSQRLKLIGREIFGKNFGSADFWNNIEKEIDNILPLITINRRGERSLLLRHIIKTSKFSSEFWESFFQSVACDMICGDQTIIPNILKFIYTVVPVEARSFGDVWGAIFRYGRLDFIETMVKYDPGGIDRALYEAIIRYSYKDRKAKSITSSNNYLTFISYLVNAGADLNYYPEENFYEPYNEYNTLQLARQLALEFDRPEILDAIGLGGRKIYPIKN